VGRQPKTQQYRADGKELFHAFRSRKLDHMRWL